MNICAISFYQILFKFDLLNLYNKKIAIIVNEKDKIII